MFWGCNLLCSYVDKWYRYVRGIAKWKVPLSLRWLPSKETKTVLEKASNKSEHGLQYLWLPDPRQRPLILTYTPAMMPLSAPGSHHWSTSGAPYNLPVCEEVTETPLRFFQGIVFLPYFSKKTKPPIMVSWTGCWGNGQGGHILHSPPSL